METEYQNLDWAIPIIKQQLKEYPTSKISTVFKRLRNNPRLTLFGDYPLYVMVIKELKKQNRSINKSEIKNAFKISKELRNKKTIVDTLFNTEFCA